MSWSRQEIAERVAQDIPDGAYVNLGIGMPTLVANHVPPGRQFVLHTENGMLGMGRAAEDDEVDPDLINAGKIHVTEEAGAAYFDHAESFGMIRGRHLGYCVIGAYQVSQDGDLANWRTSSPTVIPGVGGAMDLAVGARHVFVAMNLFTRSGECKLVETCGYPLTATRCVERVYTDHGVFAPSPEGMRVVELIGSLGLDELRERSGLELVDAERWRAESSGPLWRLRQRGSCDLRLTFPRRTGFCREHCQCRFPRASRSPGHRQPACERGLGHAASRIGRGIYPGCRRAGPRRRRDHWCRTALLRWFGPA